MQLGLTVIALVAPGQSPALCYAQIREIRRDDRYPPPSLPDQAKKPQLVRLAPACFGAMLVCWDQALKGEDVEHILAELRAGRLTVPSNAPELGGLSVSGVVSHDTWVAEGVDRVPIDGAGVLRSTTLSIPSGASEVLKALQTALGRAEVARELQVLIEAIDDQIGLRHGLLGRGRLGAVEHLWRASGPGSRPPLKITTIKPDVRSSDPCRTVVLARAEGADRRPLRIQLRVFASDEIILDRLIQLEAEQDELRVDVGRHLTRVSARIYDNDTGELADELELSFIQSIGVGLNLRTAVDLLPPPFRSAPTATDLTERARTTRSDIEIGGGDTRDPSASAIRANTETFEVLLGPKAWRAQSHFFQSGPQPQVDVIRWMKEQFERGDVAESFLIDPYLGSQAFERVINRHGNEDIKLTVVVSPGRVDPDASEMDAESKPGAHIQHLVTTAEASKDALCGQLTLVHVQRAQGARQAFHDRYLGLVLKSGRPEVYLLSNSLSKAAGDWPFVVAEVDTPTAWEIASYVAGLTTPGGKELSSQVIWQSGQTTTNRVVSGKVPYEPHPLWNPYLKLSELNQSDRLDDDEAIALVVTEVLEALPSAASPDEQARLIIEGMHGRDHFSAKLAKGLRQRLGYETLSEALEEALLEEALKGVAPVDGDPPQFLPELAVLQAAGHRLAARPKGTDVLRNDLNPIVHDYATALELGRGGKTSLRAMLAGIASTVIGLETAWSGDKLPAKFRAGIALDYINLLARLFRSQSADEWFCQRTNPAPALPVARYAIEVADRLADSIGDKVADAMRLLREDPWAATVISAIDAAYAASIPAHLRH